MLSSSLDTTAKVAGVRVARIAHLAQEPEAGKLGPPPGYTTGIWGPLNWEVMHLFANAIEAYKAKFPKEKHIHLLLAIAFSNFVMFQCLTCICVHCRRSLRSFLSSIEEETGQTIEEHVAKENASYWVYMLHRVVNEKLDEQCLESKLERFYAPGTEKYEAAKDRALQMGFHTCRSMQFSALMRRWAVWGLRFNSQHFWLLMAMMAQALRPERCEYFCIVFRSAAFLIKHLQPMLDIDSKELAAVIAAEKALPTSPKDYATAFAVMAQGFASTSERESRKAQEYGKEMYRKRLWTRVSLAQSSSCHHGVCH